MHDIGGDAGPGEDLNDSVFLGDTNTHQRTPPDLSPLLPTTAGPTLHPSAASLIYSKKSNLESNNSSVELNSDDDLKLIPKSSSSSSKKNSLHRNRYFCFEDASIIQNKENESSGGSFNNNNIVRSVTKKTEIKLNSPNLSPIRQDELLVKETTKSSLNKSSLNKKKDSNKKSTSRLMPSSQQHMNTDDDVNMSSGSKSLIFMDTCVNKQESGEIGEDDKANNDAAGEGQNFSFSESIVNHEHKGHYPREEFYVKKLYYETEPQDADSVEINDDTYRNANNAKHLQNKSLNTNTNNNNMLHEEKQSSFLMPSSCYSLSL